MRSSCIWKLQDLTVTAFNCCLQLWIPPVPVLSASLLQRLLLSSHSNSSLSFPMRLPYLGTSNLLLCQTPSLSKLSLEAVANTVVGRNFPFQSVLWYLHLFIWKKLTFCILQNSSTDFDTAVLAFSSFMAQAFIFLRLHPQPNKTDSVKCHLMEELPSEHRMVWPSCSAW